MQLAVNYSTQLENLLINRQVEVDLIKCPDWQGLIDAALIFKPVYIHFDLLLGNQQPIRAGQIQNIKALMRQTGTQWVNFHLIAPKNATIHSKSDLLGFWLREMDDILKVFEPHQIVVENFPFYSSQPQNLYAVDADTIHRLIDQTQCGFLLDLAHAKITTISLKTKLDAYLSALPLYKLKEVHITGIQKLSGWWVDHLPCQREDYQALNHLLTRLTNHNWALPKIIALEYGGVGELFSWRSNGSEIRSQIHQLNKIIAKQRTSNHPHGC